MSALFSGLPEAEAFREIEDRRKKGAARRPSFGERARWIKANPARAQAVSNGTEGVVSPQK